MLIRYHKQKATKEKSDKSLSKLKFCVKNIIKKKNLKGVKVK